MINPRRGDRCHLNRPHIEPRPRQRTSECFTSNVIPMCARFTVCQYSQPVRKPDRAKMMDIAVHDGSQTDSAVTWRSKTNQIWFLTQLPLSYMVIRHFTRDQCPPPAIARKHDQLQIWRKFKPIQLKTVCGHLKRLKCKSLPSERQKPFVIRQINSPE